ncbi:MAG: hypothetical protein IT261_09630 [Saprospiraceae bacterium]|nr:hypothetical protein [Saprospiraceae bacterium]
MKKTLISLSIYRLLLLFILHISLSAEALAQDTMPEVELTPVRQREVMDHYINKVWTSKGWQIQTFDGAKESVLNFDHPSLISVSPNQRYFTVAKPVSSPKGGILAYQFELRNLSNTVLARGRLSSLGSDGEESHDEFVPSDDGLGVVQKSNLALSGGLRFVLFQRKNNTLIKLFEVNKTAFWNANIIYEPSQKMIVATFEGHIPDTKISQAHLQCYSPDGTLQWETALDSQHVKSELFISAFDGTIAFVSRNAKDESHKNLFLFEKNGKLIRQIPVYRGGVYKRSYFHTYNGRQYFLSPSDGEYYYVIDTQSCEIANHQTHAREGASVMGLTLYQPFVVTSYCTGYFRPGPNNTQEPDIKDWGLGIGNLVGSVTYIPLNLTGYPFLFSTKAGLFLREQIGIGVNETNNFYRINLK